MASEATAEKFPKITLRVRLYHGLKRLDLRCELDKEETTAKEGVYIAFPFACEVERGGLWLEYPDAITEPLKDQHSSACRDWYAVQRWLAASDGEATVVLSPLDSPLVTLGGPTASTWLRQLSLKRAHVFAYVMNNYWYTNYKASQGGRQVFRFSLTSARGGFSKRDAVARGWEMYLAAGGASPAGGPLKPLLSAPAASLVGVEPAGLPLMAFKQAEDGEGLYLPRLRLLRRWRQAQANLAQASSGNLHLRSGGDARRETGLSREDGHRPAQAVCAGDGQSAVQVSRGHAIGLPEAAPKVNLAHMSTVVEIETAIQRLTPSEVAELSGWLSEYQQMIQASAEVFAMYDREEDSCKKPTGETSG